MKLPLLLAIIASFCGVSFAQDRPTTKVLDCTTSGCHTKELDHQFLHGPTAVSACDACHDYQDPAKHSFTLKRPGKQLCNFCHIDKTGSEGPVVHEPVAKGECTSCHDPHGSASRKMLKKNTTPELCTTCHKTTLAGSHVHRPAGEECTTCHSPHTGQFQKLLKMEPRALCVSCHQAVEDTVTKSPHAHKPAQGDCLQCHDPHSSNQARTLKSAPADLCINCHKTIGETIAAAAQPHTATTNGKACLNCHTPHGSEHAKQLFQDPVAACLACHSKNITAASDKHVVGALTEFTPDVKSKHGPVAKGVCSECHDVHGGKHGKLLVLPYESEFYQPYSETSYALCFKCHDRNNLIGTAKGVITGFRDGTRNLHTVHITKAPQGRNCRACHAIHASHHEKLLADEVKFGEWRLPLKFIKTDTGGSCSPGCHKPGGYDRENPVLLKLPPPGANPVLNPTGTTPPATAPATPPANPPVPTPSPAPASGPK